MNAPPRQISLADWDARYDELAAGGLEQPWYGGKLSRHLADGDYRLRKLRFDNSPAALRLWNFLLTEEDRLHAARAAGKKIIGTMKDLGTVPVMAYSLPDAVAFYPDGAWWIPCVMEMSTSDLKIADALGIDDSFCPVRAMLGAFVNGEHFPLPDLLTCSVGATCDDFSAIAQRLEGLGHEILWWEMPPRRRPGAGEEPVALPGGFVAPASQVNLVRGELERIRLRLQEVCNDKLDDAALAAGIARANEVRAVLRQLRDVVYGSPTCPLPALEMLIAEMLAIHFCSDQRESRTVLNGLLAEAQRRAAANLSVLDGDPARIFWVNPVADLAAMNLLEQCGGRLCGSELLFSHALDAIPADLPPMEALARMALADPMAGPVADRADRIDRDIRRFGAEAVVVSRIPGASHCAMEGSQIAAIIERSLGLPTVEIEVPPLCEALGPTIRTRLEALVETARARRTRRT